MTDTQKIGDEYLDEFRERRGHVLEYLDDSIGTLREWEHPEGADRVQKWRDEVSEGIFSIVMVGEFSAGKSTLLNALMHKKTLPSFTSETTATVNFLRHADCAPEPGVCGMVYYQDGTQKKLTELSDEVLEKEVSTRGDTEEAKIAATVNHVDLFFDSNFLKKGVMLVDSPGLNSNSDLHQEITRKQIKDSHASIFVFRSSQPGTKSDFEYLRELKESHKSDNIFYLLNRIDEIKASEETLDDVIKNIQENYQKYFPGEGVPKIWPVSGYYALAARNPEPLEFRPGEYADTEEKRARLEELSRMADFEKRLKRYLARGPRTRRELIDPVERTIKMFSNLRKEIIDRVSGLEQETSSAELREKKEALEHEIGELKKNRQGISGDIKKEVELALNEAREKARSQCAAILAEARNRLELLDTPDEIGDCAGELNRMVHNRLQRIAGALDDDLRTRILEIIGDEYEDFANVLEDKLPESEGYSSLRLAERDIVVKELSTGVNLEQFTQDCEKLETQIGALEGQLRQATQDKLKARRLEREKNEYREELKSLRQSMQYLNDTFVLPDVHYHTEKQTVERSRGGLLGGVIDLIFGGKAEVIDVPVTDSTARDAAQRQFDQRKAELDAQIAEAQKRLNEAPRADADSDEYEAERQRLAGKMQILEAKLSQAQSDFREKLRVSSEKTCKKLRQDIVNQVDGLQQDAAEAICSHLRDQERQCIRAAQDMLNAALEQEMQTLQRKLDDIISDLEKEGEDRDLLIENLKGKISAATDLINHGAELQELLDEALKDLMEKGDDSDDE